MKKLLIILLITLPILVTAQEFSIKSDVFMIANFGDVGYITPIDQLTFRILGFQVMSEDSAAIVTCFVYFDDMKKIIHWEYKSYNYEKSTGKEVIGAFHEYINNLK